MLEMKELMKEINSILANIITSFFKNIYTYPVCNVIMIVLR